MKRRSVVVTGLGIVSPFGVGRDPFWRGLVQGHVATRAVRRFETSHYASCNGGEVEGIEPAQAFQQLAAADHSHATQFAVVAAREAILDAKLTQADFAALGERAGVVMG